MSVICLHIVLKSCERRTNQFGGVVNYSPRWRLNLPHNTMCSHFPELFIVDLCVSFNILASSTAINTKIATIFGASTLLIQQQSTPIKHFLINSMDDQTFHISHAGVLSVVFLCGKENITIERRWYEIKLDSLRKNEALCMDFSLMEVSSVRKRSLGWMSQAW